LTSLPGGLYAPAERQVRWAAALLLLGLALATGPVAADEGNGLYAQELQAELVEQLQSTEPDTRIAGLRALRWELPGTEQERAVRLLEDPVPAVRAAAAENLVVASDGDGMLIGPVAALLFDPAAEVRVSAARALGLYGRRAYAHVPALETQLRCGDFAEAQAAAQALRSMDGGMLFIALEQQLHLATAHDPAVRQAALTALAAIGPLPLPPPAAEVRAAQATDPFRRIFPAILAYTDPPVEPPGHPLFYRQGQPLPDVPLYPQAHAALAQLTAALDSSEAKEQLAAVQGLARFGPHAQGLLPRLHALERTIGPEHAVLQEAFSGAYSALALTPIPYYPSFGAMRLRLDEFDDRQRTLDYFASDPLTFERVPLTPGGVSAALSQLANADPITTDTQRATNLLLTRSFESPELTATLVRLIETRDPANLNAMAILAVQQPPPHGLVELLAGELRPLNGTWDDYTVVGAALYLVLAGERNLELRPAIRRAVHVATTAPEIRSLVLGALARTPQAAVPHLLKAVRSSNDILAANACIHLARCGATARAAIPALQARLRRAVGGPDHYAAYALVHIEPAAAAQLVVPLREELSMGPSEYAFQSAWLLGRMGPHAAGGVHDLRNILLSDDYDYRLAAAVALERIEGSAR
jgi:hypothetical protein